MIEHGTIFIALVFALAGLVKGVIGLGLPTISIGLLAIVMSPLEAAAALILPSFVTNFWQMVSGPSLRAIVRRLWPMMLAVCAGSWAGIGLLTAGGASYSRAFLGFAVALYAIAGLASFRMTVRPSQEGWMGPIVGGATGLVTAATGVFVLPGVPYLQAIGLNKDDLVQALGLFFMVSTIALAVNVAFEGGFSAGISAANLGAVATACLGMWIGQKLRLRLQPEKFRVIFFAGLLVLGLYLFARAVI